MARRFPPPPARVLSRLAAFSLVEVSLAIAIVAVAFVALLGLLPVGLGIFREAMGTSVGAQIAQRVLNDAQQADFDTLVHHLDREEGAKDGLTFRQPLRYFDEQGNEVLPDTASTPNAGERLRIIYHVNTRITVRASRPQVSSETEAGSALDLALVTVQVATNPGQRVLAFRVDPPSADDQSDAQRNLFAPAPGVRVSTWSTMVARNQPSIPAKP